MAKPKIIEDVADPSQTRGQKVARREAAIIAAAREMFNTRGFAKTPIADIAKASGVADGTVYLYFKNKQALASAVLSAFYDDLTKAAQTGVDALSAPPERLRFLARHHLETVLAHWRLLEILSLVQNRFEDYEGSDLYGLNLAYVGIFDRVAKDAVAQGFIREGLNAWVLRDTFFGAMDYGTRTIMIKRRNADIDVFVDTLCALILKTPKAADETSRLDAIASRMEAALDKLETQT